MLFQFTKKTIFIGLIIVFMSTQLLGLFTGIEFSRLVDQGYAEPAFNNPNDVNNSIFLMGYILVVTALFIFLIKFWKPFIKILEAAAIFFTSAIVLDLLIPVGFFGIAVGEILALILTIVKMKWPTHLTQNVALVFSVAGAGGLIGASLGVFPIIVFMFLLSIYDFIAVFITKHMVYMAKALTDKPTAFTAAFPVKDKKLKHVFQLGGGDLVIPLIFSVAVYQIHGLISLLFVMSGELLALLGLFYFVLQKPGFALPALPPISAMALLGLMVSLLI